MSDTPKTRQAILLPSRDLFKGDYDEPEHWDQIVALLTLWGARTIELADAGVWTHANGGQVWRQWRWDESLEGNLGDVLL